MIEDMDPEIERILAMSDEEIMEAHLEFYEGNQELADKATYMLRAKLEALLATTNPKPH